MNKTIQAFGLFIIASLVIASCKPDPVPETSAVIASFQYEVSESNWAEVTFTNYSANATFQHLGFRRWKHQHGNQPHPRV